MDFKEWYEQVYPRLSKCGCWLRGGELNTVPTDEYAQHPFRVLFCRLSTYEDTVGSFAHLLLYQIAREVEGVFPDLAYLPPSQDLPILEQGKVPWLIGTQTKLGPDGFDLIGFSNSIVQELINLPLFLNRSRIPLRKSERLQRPDIPLLVLGGSNALCSSALWVKDPPVDGIFIGENDRDIRRIFEICREAKKSGSGKTETLDRLAQEVTGFILPDCPAAVKKSVYRDLGESVALTSGPVPFLSSQPGEGHLQISEGCPGFCSFCAESWGRKPYRERKRQQLAEIARQAKAGMGWDSAGIYSFNFNTHSEIYGILWDLIPLFNRIGLKSQRFDLLAKDPVMAEFQHAIGKSSFTCGLEGISERLRSYLRKNLKIEEVYAALNAVVRSKPRELKIFLIATGLEEEADFAEFERFLAELKIIQMRSQARVILSMTPLVRFPWTPLEFEDAFPIERYEHIIRKTGGIIRKCGFEFREAASLSDYWVSQVLARASDERVLDALYKAIERSGFIYYRDVPVAFIRQLEQCLRESGVEPAELLRGFSLEESMAKPWACVDTGVRREFLWAELQRIRAFQPSSATIAVRAVPGFSLEKFRDRIRRERDAEVTVRFLIDVGAAGRGLPRQMVAMALARALMRVEPRLVDCYRGFTGSHWAQGERPVWITGSDIISLTWSRQVCELLSSLVLDPLFLGRVNQQLESWGTLRGMHSGERVPERIDLMAAYEFKPDKYLLSLGIKYCLRKRAEGVYTFEFTPQSLKKGVVMDLLLDRSVPGQTSVSLRAGRKLDIEAFIRNSFALGDSKNWVRILAEAKME